MYYHDIFIYANIQSHFIKAVISTKLEFTNVNEGFHLNSEAAGHPTSTISM